MECWDIVVVLELIQYEDTEPADAPLGPPNFVPPPVPESRSAAFLTFLPADPRVPKGELAAFFFFYFFYLEI